MPDTWTVIFDLSNAEKVKTSLKQAEEEINELKVLLSEKKKGKEMDFTVARNMPYITGAARRPTPMDNIRIKNTQERRACKRFFVL
nr:hypothetical protein [uncultured Oribacterium sp.]